MARSRDKYNRLKRLERQKVKALCSDYGKSPKTVSSKFFEKKPNTLPKGIAKIERKLKGMMVLKRDAHHIVTLQRNFIDRTKGETHNKLTPNRAILISKFFNTPEMPYKHLCFEGMSPFLNCKRYRVKPRRLA